MCLWVCKKYAKKAVKESVKKETVKPPTNVKIIKTSDSRLNISWKTYLKKEKVDVEIQENDGKYKLVKSTDKNKYRTKKLKLKNKYNVRLKARNKDKSSEYVYFYDIFKEDTESVVVDSQEKKVENGDTQKDGATQKGQLVDEQRTKIVNLGFCQYVVITFKGDNNMTNTRVSIDGVDVTEALTKVSDDGKVAKWELYKSQPAKMEICSKQNSNEKQKIVLSNNKSAIKPEVVKNTAPKYILTHGRLSYADYYLSNYDSQGKLRYTPKKTTFNVMNKENKEENKGKIKAYSPVAEAVPDKNAVNKVSGTVEIMFNYSTAEEKDWFDKIQKENALELVNFDQQKYVLNNHLKYEKLTTKHGKSTVGLLKIPFGQDNFTQNKRYYNRVKSNGNKSALVPIKVVQKETPQIKLKESGELVSGSNIHFQISNMVHGLNEPIEKVTLVNPKGEEKVLEHITDYFMYGNTGLFVLYNDVSRDGGRNNIPYAGIYTLKIESDGFKDIVKKFEVQKGQNVNYYTDSKVRVDNVSSATVAPGGQGGSGGGNISANILFDADLLSNAMILEKIGLANDDAKNISNRFSTEVSCDYVYGSDINTAYEWTDYYDAVSESKLDGKYLRFSDYVKLKTTKGIKYRPSSLKEVLEFDINV